MAVSKKKVRTVTFYARTWNLNEDDGLCHIFITGKTKKGKSVTIRVDNFCPYVYLELPPVKKWSDRDARGIFEYFKEKCGSIGPIGYFLDSKYDLYHKFPRRYIMLTFKASWHATVFSKKCSSYHNVRGVFNFDRNTLRVHEQNFDPIIKFRAIRNVNPSGWIEATEYVPKEVKEGVINSNFSDSDISMFCLWNKVSPSECKDLPPDQRILSFDIETYSENHNAKDPDPRAPNNPIFQIALTLEYHDKVEQHLLSLYMCPNIKNATVRNYATERDMLLDFIEITLSLKPDIIIGYNILKFDWDYIINRAELLGIMNKLKRLTRIPILDAEVGECNWASSAYGKQIMKYLDIPGVLNIDLYPEMCRNYKLDKYTLEFVSMKFLGEGKEKITYRQMFRIVQICIATDKFRRQEDISDVDIARIKKYVRKTVDDEELFDVDGNPTIIHKFVNKIYDAYETDEMKKALEWGIYKIGVYCIKDTYLPMRLLKKLYILSGLEQMSNTVGLPIKYLQTRGQQVKVLSMVYSKTSKQNIVIPYKGYKEESIKKYQGATVFKAVPGFYKNVACLDFSSLYPSIIIAYNICWTTFVVDESIPDEECNVLEFEEHYLCEHDPDVVSGKKKCQVGKTKKTKQKDGTYLEEEVITLCGKHRYRFLKVKKDENGNLINEGVLPSLLKNVLLERKKVKKEMEENELYLKMHDGKVLEEDIERAKQMGWRVIEKGSLSEQEYRDTHLRFVRANALQLALKVSANSAYGGMGAKTGFMPLLEGASSVTAMGRILIRRTADFIKENYPDSELVYGDSVTGDTPILCRNRDGYLFYDTIEKLAESEWEMYHGNKEAANSNVEVWTDKGFTPIKRVIRHKTNKPILRVLTHTGCVDVTPDHSLLNENGEKVKPTEVRLGDALLHSDLPNSTKFMNEVGVKEAFILGRFSDEPVPIQVLNAPYEVRKQYISSCLSRGGLVCSSKLRAAGLYYLFSSVGMSTGIEVYDNVYTLNGTTECGDIIKSITNLGTTSQYVYDLETENHHFSAGVGRMIVHNTDSVMVYFNGDTLQIDFELAERASKEVSNILPRPLFLEFENMYMKMLLLSKKRYVTYRCNKKGEITGVTEKGVVLARRDNCHYLRDTYRELSRYVLDEKEKKEVMYLIYDCCYRLFTHNIPLQKFVVFKSIKDPHEYSDDSHDAHVMLARRMIDRGEEVPANTRLEYVFLDINDPEKEKLVGNKTEEYSYFRDNRIKLGLKLDPIHYLEKQLAKPITELINVRFPGDVIDYIDPRLYVFGLIDNLPLTVQNEVKTRHSTMRIRIEELARICTIKKVGIKDEKRIREYNEVIELCDVWSSDETTYEQKMELYKRLFGHITTLCPEDQKVLCRLKGNERVKYLMNGTVSTPSSDFMEQCRRLCAMYVINKIRQEYGLKAIRYHRPMGNKKIVVRDEYLMKEMVNSHKKYREVVKHLKKLFYCFEIE